MRITPELALFINVLWMGPILFEGLQQEWSAPWALSIVVQIALGYKMWKDEERRNINAEIYM